MPVVARGPAAPDSLHPASRHVVEDLRAMLLLARDAGVRWAGDACYRFGASLAYAALFSIFPLLLLCVTGFGYFLGDGEEVRRQVIGALSHVTSPEARVLLDQTLESMQTHRTARGIGALVGVVGLLMGASGVFSELQAALDTIWRVEAAPAPNAWSAILQAVRSKAFSVAVVLASAIVLLLSLVLSAALSAVSAATTRYTGVALWPLLDGLASAALLALLLALVYRVVPQTQVGWRDVGFAAAITSLIFSALKGALAYYLGHLAGYAAYGAVGAVLGLLTWIYVASLVFLWGAEYSRVYAERFGSLAKTAGSKNE